MSETEQHARERARKEGFPQSQVVKSEKGGWFIAPHGVTKTKAKKAYANCRADGGDKDICASVAWKVQNG